MQAKVMSGHIYPAVWAAQLIPPWGLLAELISISLFSLLVPATSVEGNKEEPAHYFNFYAEI